MFEQTVAPSELLSTNHVAETLAAATTLDAMAESANLFEGMDPRWDGVINPRLFSQMAAGMLGNSENTSADGLSNVTSQSESDAWTQLLSGGGAGGGGSVWDSTNGERRGSGE